MNDPYKVLGLTSKATTDEVKQAYRKLAMKHHPDRNDGSDEKFKEIQAAYEKVKDGPPMVSNPFTSAGGFDFRHAKTKEDFADIIREARYRHQMQVSLTAGITLKDAVTGQDQILGIPIHGQTEHVKVNIPAGLRDGESIRYPKLANNTDVIIQYRILPEANWGVDGLNLIRKQDVNIWDLITGTEMNVDTIAGGAVRIRIPAGTQPNTTMRVQGKGIPSRERNNLTGDMLVLVNAKIPKDIPVDLLEMIRKQRGSD